MTETDWRECRDPGVLLEFLRPRASNRKLKLFDAACARGVWHLLCGASLRDALAEAEECCDHEGVREPAPAVLAAVSEAVRELGETTREADRFWRAARQGAWASTMDRGTMRRSWLEAACRRLDCRAASQAAKAALIALSKSQAGDEAHIFTWKWQKDQAAQAAASAARYEAESLAFRAKSAPGVAPPDVAGEARTAADALYQAVRSGQAALLRDIFGDTFLATAFDPSWRTPTAVSVARRMYDDRDFTAMPVLADALQEGGCEMPDILDHSRRPGEHVKGCWVVDWALSRV
jgi:hypothetical protein